MFKGKLDFGDQLLCCGDAEQTWKQLPLFQDAHIQQNFARSPEVCWFFMHNSYGVANIIATVNEPINLAETKLDWLIQTSISLSDSEFLVLTTPDGNEMRFPVHPGVYTMQIGRNLITDEEDGEPEEDVYINLSAAASISPSTVLKCPSQAEIPQPLVEEVSIRF
jgi:hypothetical protein